MLDYLREVKARSRASSVVLAPISFISDHMEVLYDLDIEAKQLCESLSLPMARAKTVGVHPKFIAMIRELILERISQDAEKRALGALGPGERSVTRPSAASGPAADRDGEAWQRRLACEAPSFNNHLGLL